MPLVEGEGYSSDPDRRNRRGGGGGGAIPTAPGSPGGGGSGGSGGGGQQGGTSSSTGTSTSSSSASSSSGSGGGGGVDYRKKAGQRYVDQANNLDAQARALRLALNKTFELALDRKLADVRQVLRQQDRTLIQGYRARVESLAGAVEDNEKSAAGQTQAAAQNRNRERANALSEIAAQGAGESDALRAQMMSLRNWQANQSEINRAQFDTLRSINSGLTDLNVDTKSGRINLAAQAQADMSQLYTSYYNQRAETFTQLGNVLGQKADYLDMAKEYGVGKGGQMGAASKAFMSASKELGKSWDAPGISKKLRRWDGRDEFTTQAAGTSQLAAMPSVNLGQAPEGATLRKW